MWPLAQAFIDIALHRRGPEDLPASQFLLGLVLLVYLVLQIVSLQLSEPFPRALAIVLIESLAYLGFVWLLLLSFGRGRRFAQTATALLGTSCLLTLFAVPVFVWSDSLAGDDVELTLPAVLALLLLLWSIDISGHVLSRALDKPYIVGVVIVIVYVLASMELRGILFPTTG